MTLEYYDKPTEYGQLLKRLFTPEDIKLSRWINDLCRVYPSTAPETKWAYIKRFNILDPELYCRASLGSMITELIIAAIKAGMNNCQIIDNFANSPLTRDYYRIFSSASSSVNDGGFITIIEPLRYKIVGGRHFILRDALNEQLDHTDIGSKTPVSFLRPPFPTVYVEFGEEKRLGEKIFAGSSGLHICDGVFVTEYIINNPESELSIITRHGANIDPKHPVRCLDLLFTGSGYGKEGITDDATASISLFIQKDEDVASLIERHFDYYFNCQAFVERLREKTNQEFDLYNMHNMTHDEAKFFQWGILHLAKALLYINSEQVVKEEVNERNEVLARLERVGPKKQKKLQGQLKRSVNAIYIGNKNVNKDWLHAQQTGQIKTHWRRGHFRNQRYGEQLSLIKNIWIAPTLVAGHNELNKPIEPKPYKVK